MAFEEPLLPLVALPFAEDVEVPLVPPTATPVASPELPEEAEPNEPPAPLLEPLPDELLCALPVEPDAGAEVAFPPAPEEEVDVGLEVAVPVDPVEPEVALDDELALPEWAKLAATGSDEAEPVLPVVPLLPDAAEAWPSPWPEPPVDDELPVVPVPLLPEVSTPAASAAADADCAELCATICDVVADGVCAGLLSAAAKARARTKPGDMIIKRILRVGSRECDKASVCRAVIVRKLSVRSTHVMKCDG